MRPTCSTLFPYTTLFRSLGGGVAGRIDGDPRQRKRERDGRDEGASHRASSGKAPRWYSNARTRSEEHTSELQSLTNLVCRLLLEKKNNNKKTTSPNRTYN